jgi:hypothetical protein
LRNRWDEIVSHRLVRCELCGEVVHTALLKDSLDAKLHDLVEALCVRHKLERQAGVLAGRNRPPGRVEP